MTRRPRFQSIAGLLALVSACGTSVDLGGTTRVGIDGGQDGAMTCAAFAPPGTSAPCDACKQGDSGCQANGCFNGYLCDTNEHDCKAPGTACGSSIADGGGQQ